VKIEAIGQAVEAALGERRGRPSKEKRPNLDELQSGQRTDAIAADKTGFSRSTYNQAKKFVATGAPELVCDLVLKMRT